MKFFQRMKGFLRRLYLKKEGTKETLRKVAIGWTGAGLALVVILSLFFRTLDQDTSFLAQGQAHSTKRRLNSEDASAAEAISPTEQLLDRQSEMARQRQRSKKRSVGPKVVVNYSAPQILLPGENERPALPTGTELRAELVTAIDTRESSGLYKVMISRTSNTEVGEMFPQGTLLLGSLSPLSKARRVQINLTKAVFLDGSEASIQAHVLDAADKSPGIKGEFHGRAAGRVAAALGLSMLSAGSEVLIEKQSLGGAESGSVSARSTLKNAGLKAISEAANMEAKTMTQGLREAPAYLTVEPGTELIVVLSSKWRAP